MKHNNSAHAHRKAGKPQRPPRRQPSMDANLIDFLETRGLYQRGRGGIDFRSRKVLDLKRAA